jgi:PAS domain-containing protein
MTSLRDDRLGLEREILEILAGASGIDDGVFGALARAFSRLCANGNAGIASLTGHGEGVAVLAAHPVPPAFDDEAWPADAALATLIASDTGASAPLGTYDFWLAAVGVAPGRHHLSGIAIRADDGTALGVLFTVGAIDTAFAKSPLLPLLCQRAARELQARAHRATLRANQLLYRTAAQIAGNRVLVHDRAGILRDVSPDDGANWPYVRELIIGRHFSESIPPGPAALFANAQRTVLDTGETWIGEYEIDLPQGRRWREIRVAAFDRDHTLSVIRDITEARLALQALRDSEMHKRAIVEALPDTLLVNDADGVYVEAPVVSEGAWRYDTIDALGKRFADVLPAPVATLFANGQAAVLRHRRTVPGRIRDRRGWQHTLARIPHGAARCPADVDDRARRHRAEACAGFAARQRVAAAQCRAARTGRHFLDRSRRARSSTATRRCGARSS